MKKSLDPKPIIYPNPVLVVGTYDVDGNANAMTASWAGVCSSSPPCIAISIRNATYTYNNLIARKAFTVSIPSEDYIREADYFGVVSGEEGGKLQAAGLTPTRSDVVDAPYVEEFPLALECKVVQTVTIGSHVQFIGEIVGIKADEAVVGKNGRLNIEQIRPILYAPGNRAYYGIGDVLGKAFTMGKDLSPEVQH